MTKHSSRFATNEEHVVFSLDPNFKVFLIYKW